MLDETQRELPWSCCVALIRELCKLVPVQDVESLGVLAGARAQLSDLDLAGLNLRSETTVRAAAEFHREHRELFEPSPLTSVYLTDETLVIALTAQAGAPVEPRLTECLLASILTMVHAISGPVTPIDVQLQHPRPRDDGAHRRVLGSTLRFDSALDAVVLPRDVFERTLPHRDDHVRAVLQPHLSRQLQEVQAARSDLSMRALLAIRQELGEGAPSAASLAKRLRVSPRSLRRALHARATTYSALLSQARCELALQYLVAAPRRSGPEIARLLGYADAHTFYRAFRRWTGVSLSAYRLRHQS
jgi:AraC-like DNA-binding protein